MLTPSEQKSFLAQFDQARTEVARFKKTIPYIFPEWQALKIAEREFEQAQLKLETARNRWEKR